jgi:hypothetical protein
LHVFQADHPAKSVTVSHKNACTSDPSLLLLTSSPSNLVRKFFSTTSPPTTQSLFAICEFLDITTNFDLRIFYLLINGQDATGSAHNYHHGFGRPQVLAFGHLDGHPCHPI